jgi:ADP-heptose:LPS heptosyltransferase
MGKIVSTTPPAVRQSSLSWQLSRLLLPRLKAVATVGGWLTVWDSFGTPGDTISTGTIARVLKQHFPGLRLNVITPNPALLEFDPNVDRLNAPPTLLLLRFWYIDLIDRRDAKTNLLSPTLAQAGIGSFDYKAEFHLTNAERDVARSRIAHLKKPILTVNVQSREKVKMWPIKRWTQVVEALSPEFDVVQLGAGDEPDFENATRLAGHLTMRESAAVLSLARAHVGCVSFLMHVANGVDVPAVIVYGGREKPENSGYRTNVNLASSPPCSPCWLHDSRGDVCPHDMICMEQVTVPEVLDAIRKVTARR